MSYEEKESNHQCFPDCGCKLLVKKSHLILDRKDWGWAGGDVGQGWEIGEESRVYFQLKLEIPVRHPMGDVEETFGK